MLMLIIRKFLFCLIFLAAVNGKRHHRDRKAVPLSVTIDCKEPKNLDWTLNSWRNEMQISDPPMESFDEEWQSLNSEPKICDLRPKGGEDSSLMERALCPWQWRQNHDENREPKIIAEAFCLCKHARGNSPAYCMSIRHEVPILKRIHCNPITRTWHYAKSTQSITVACHSVFARHAKASPLSNHYRVFTSEI